MSEITLNGIPVQFPGEVDRNAAANLRTTLQLVPARHLPILRRIVVFTPQPSADPYAGGDSGQGYPRLSALCFDRRRRPNNYPFNLTLLHEIGHIVDHHFHCLETMRREAPDDYAALQVEIHIAPERRTHGAGELFADAYQKVLTGRGASQRVRAAVMASTAFVGVYL